MKYVTLDGKVLAAPEINSNYFIWFNRSLFNERGLDDPLVLWEKGEWTKDAFDDACRKLTTKDGDAISVYGFGFDHTWLREVFAMYDANFSVFEDGKYKNNTDDADVAAAMAYISKMNTVDKVWCDMDKANTAFASGNLAMYFHGNWLTMTDPYRKMAAQGKIDFVPLPNNRATGLGPRQNCSIGGHAIPVGAKHVDEARAFIEIFNFYKQTPEFDTLLTKAQCEINGWSVSQFTRMRTPLHYESKYTFNDLLDCGELFQKALRGESWYSLKQSFEPQLKLALSSIPSQRP